MAIEFHFSCIHCGELIVVTEKHAGMSLNCPSCDKANQLPGLRQIRQLPPVSQTSDKAAKATSGSSESKSWLFSGGLLVGVVSAVLGFALLQYAFSLSSESTVQLQIEFGRDQIDRLPPGHLWDVWDGMTAQGLPDWQETRQVRYNKQSHHLRNISYGLFGISVIGFMALIGSFFVRR